DRVVRGRGWNHAGVFAWKGIQGRVEAAFRKWGWNVRRIRGRLEEVLKDSNRIGEIHAPRGVGIGRVLAGKLLTPSQGRGPDEAGIRERDDAIGVCIAPDERRLGAAPNDDSSAAVGELETRHVSRMEKLTEGSNCVGPVAVTRDLRLLEDVQRTDGRQAVGCR